MRRTVARAQARIFQRKSTRTCMENHSFLHYHSKNHSKKPIWSLALLAVVSVVWLIVRTGTKPSRITYPCQKAAVSNINIFLAVLALPFIGLRSKLLPGRIPRSRVTTGVMVTTLLVIMAVSNVSMFIRVDVPAVNLTSVALDLQSQTAAAASPSNLFIIQNASGLQGNMDAAMSALLSSMQSHGLSFFKTSVNPSGLIGKNDVIIIKVNGQSPQRGGTNTDLAKGLTKTIVGHPEGFTGEVVIADNGQSTGGVDMTENNAYDHSQSMTDVAGMFPTYKVSAYSWWTIASNSVTEYSIGNYQDGYVVNSTANAVTGLKVSYPKFRTAFGTYISFKNGVWSQSTGTYDSSRLKIINLPLFKSHYMYAATACVKNYMGVGSQTLTGEHDTVGNGGMGTQMVETRFPTLNIIDGIWINANPFQPGSSYDSPCGPFTSYDVASYTNLIGASTDPVALEYWIAKHVAIPAAIQRGYSYTSSIDPDYEPITQNLLQSYHHYLTAAMNVIKNSGRQTTMLESEISVYVTTLNPSNVLFSDGFEFGSFSVWSQISMTTGETATVSSSVEHNGRYSARFTGNGGGGIENAVVTKSLISFPEVYARGYFRVTQNGIADDNDRFYFIVLKSTSGNNIAYAGWRRTTGSLRWCLVTRASTGYTTVYSTTTPALNRWYSMEVHWRYGNPGLGELYVDGAKVCTTSGNMASYGYAGSASYGLTELYNCGPTTAYADCAVIAGSYIGPEPGQLFSSGFEGSFTGWSLGTLTTGEARSVTTVLKHHGSYSASFYSNGGGGTERSYVYRAVTASAELYLRGYVRASQSGIVQVGDRVQMLSMYAGSNAVAYGGWTQTSSGLRWFLTIRSGTGTVTAYSTSAPLLNTWYGVELHWRKGSTDGLGELWVNGVKVCSLYARNTGAYGDATQVRVGLPEVYLCGTTRVYLDCVFVSRSYIGPE